MTNTVDIKSQLPKILNSFKYEVIQDGKKSFIKLYLNKKEFLIRILRDRQGGLQLVYGYDLADHIVPGEFGEHLPHHGFISDSAYRLWEAMCYPLPMDNLKRSSDSKLIEMIQENSYEVFKDLF